MPAAPDWITGTAWMGTILCMVLQTWPLCGSREGLWQSHCRRSECGFSVGYSVDCSCSLGGVDFKGNKVVY